jgi:predicted glycoside hydrolase/deacetylase ChbG (UPF0249 family)
VNADDLGESPERNAAIAAAFDRGLVTSTSLLANGAAFDEAVEFARGRTVGVHLNLTDGLPLTAPITRFCDGGGRFRTWRGSEHAVWLGRSGREAVAREFRAQIERCRAAGVEIAHLDSHHHVHTEPALVGIVLHLARELAVPRVRLGRNAGPLGTGNRAYKTWLNGRIRRAGLAGTRWFGDARDLEWLRARGVRDADDFEQMTHPAFADTKLVLDA